MPEEWITESRPKRDTPLRRLTVEERVGVARSGELVRVPLFFHAGECRDPDGLAIYLASDAQRKHPIAYQADDIHRSPVGDVARMHVYFRADLKPWQRNLYLLYQGRNPGQDAPVVPLVPIEEGVTLSGEHLRLTLRTKGSRAGTIAALESTLGSISLPHQQLAPRLVLVRQSVDLKEQRRTPLSYLESDRIDIFVPVDDDGGSLDHVAALSPAAGRRG